MGTVICIMIGIVIGWFFLPRPAWAVAVANEVAQKFPFLARFIK